MAKQAGPFFFTGSIGDVILYKVGDQYLMRMKGSYNTKALQKPGARPLMQLKQQEFGKASKLAKEVYWRQLPRDKRGRGVHNQLTKIARELLKAGKSEAEIKTELVPLYLGEPVAATPTAPAMPTEQPPVPTQVARPKQEAKPQRVLSGWNVSAKGLLYKELPRMTVASVPSETTPKAASYCGPCRFSGFPSSVRDWSG
jgi:hypothetical protein